MKHYVSFTSIIIALSNKTISLQELENSDAILCFGCSKEHLDGHYVPIEVSWCKGNHSQYYCNDGCDIDQLTSESLKLWDELRKIIYIADVEGRVHYRIGNYPAYVNLCHQNGHAVWWQQWRQKEEVA